MTLGETDAIGIIASILSISKSVACFIATEENATMEVIKKIIKSSAASAFDSTGG